MLLYSDNVYANEHISFLQENSGYVGLIVNFQTTKALFLNS